MEANLIPDQKNTKLFSIHLNLELHTLLKSHCALNDLTMSGLINRLIEIYLKFFENYQGGGDMTLTKSINSLKKQIEEWQKEKGEISKNIKILKSVNPEEDYSFFEEDIKKLDWKIKYAEEEIKKCDNILMAARYARDAVITVINDPSKFNEIDWQEVHQILNYAIIENSTT